jgi:hypothetical protein
MALVLKDRVKETTATTGTGAVTLAGATTGYQSFSVVGNGNTTYYVISGQGTSEWEVGIGTYTASGTTLSRDTVLSSSNAGSLVNFSAGTKDVWVDYAASKAVTTDTLAYPPSIGSTTPADATFTTLTATGQASLGGAAGAEGLRVTTTASAVNYWQIQGRATGSGVLASAQGSDTNVNAAISSKGTGFVNFYTNGFAQTQLSVTHTASAVNYVQATGAATTAAPQISAQGSDANINFTLAAKGTGAVQSLSAFRAGTSGANYNQFTGAATTQSPIYSVAGSDTNISQVFQPKGTGAIDLAAGSSGVNISNGGTVTAITRTATGSSYTSIPSIAISAPTTAGGVQATASITMAAGAGSAVTPASGGTGYTLNDTLTIVGGTNTLTAQFTVTAVSGGVVTQVTRSNTNYGNYSVLPSSPVATTGGTGTGCTLNMVWEVLPPTITNAGSGYVEQPTVSFSGGGGSGAAAYATVGTNSVIRGVGPVLSFYTPGGEQVRVADSSSTSVNYVNLKGAATGSTPTIFSGGTDTNIAISVYSKGSSPIQFLTNNGAQLQFNVTHTASAVNYVQVTGAATGAAPNFQFTGSDANVLASFGTKGTGSFSFYSGGLTNRQVRIDGASAAVNYLDLYGAVASSAPSVRVGGTDTNIDLTLTPKGTGKLVTTAVALIGAGTALSGATNPLVAMTGNTNQYVQSYVVNNNAGTSASADVVAYTDNSTDSHGWVDMGFTSSVYADSTYTVTGANEAYLFGSAPSGAGKTGNLVYATDSTGSANAHQFYVGGFTQAKSAWKAQIDATGVKATQVNATNGFIVNSRTVAANYTVATGDSAMSVGPMTVASGVVVTVSSGSRWVVI